MQDPADKIVIVTPEGLRGTLTYFEQEAHQSQTHALAQFDNGQKLWVPVDSLQRQTDGTYLLSIPFENLESISQDSHEQMVIPLAAEQLQIEKRLVESGGLRVHKHVTEWTEQVNEPGYEEDLHVERIPINQILSEPVQSRYEGDTLVIPLMEEVLVVEKRLVLREEVRITKQRREVHHPQEITLRKEEVSLEPIESRPEQPPTDRDE